MIKDVLNKSYDILKEEQRNADNKAYIFIGLLTAVIGIFGQVPINGLGENGIEMLMQMLLFLLIPLFLLLYSLIPRYNAKLYLAKKDKTIGPLNLYYWKTIIQMDSRKVFFGVVQEKYDCKMNEDEKDLASQIYENVKIMSTKASLHILAFFFLIHIVIFVFSSYLFLAFGFSNYILFGVIWLVMEFAYWLVPLLKNKKKKR